MEALGGTYFRTSEIVNAGLNLTQKASFPPYPDPAAEIAEQILRVNGILRNAVQRFRRSHSIEQRNGLDSVAIFDDEIDRFLAGSPDYPPQNDGTGHDDRLRCEYRAHASAAQQIELPIDTIRRRFGLCPIELDALLLCLVVELHPGFGRVFAYLNNDLTRQRPSVALIVDILSANWAERLEARRVLGQRSPLFRYGLLAATRVGADHLTTELSLEPPVLDYVLSGRLSPGEAGAGDSLELDELLISPAERESIERVSKYLERTLPEACGPTIVICSGAPGVGRRTTARSICHELGYRLRGFGKGSLLAPALADLPHWLRDARLAGDVPGIYVPRASAEESTHLPLFLDAIGASGCALGCLFVEADEPPRLVATSSARLIGIHLGMPKAGMRAVAWKRALRDRGLDCTEEALSTIAAVYPFNAGRIYSTVREADMRRQVADRGARNLEVGMLAQVCREQTHHQLDRLAQPLPIRHGWNDIVLPPDELRRLKEIANAVRNRDRVMEEWGFEQKVSAGPGVNAIFFGPSGTGKTMAASILAGDLGMAIYRVDLSRIVSKYIGETERNLDALFEEARRSYALLFFDEAEALFGKRSEVKDAHDRYANIEVAYLLQRMEAFDGVAILATNLRKHMDNAFLRRLQFAVEFPLPAIAERLRIWRQVWPATAALSPDLDLEFMARQLELSGGHIRNIALMAAYLASQERAPISMAHILAATRREFQKLGRSCVAEQFGPYASLVEAGAKK
jgi:hypothetical protein